MVGAKLQAGTGRLCVGCIVKTCASYSYKIVATARRMTGKFDVLYRETFREKLYSCSVLTLLLLSKLVGIVAIINNCGIIFNTT